MGVPERGHRVLPHTADVILEAWGADLPSCCEEAVAALVGTYAASAGAGGARRRLVHLPGGSHESMLLDVLDEVIFTLDTAEGVPLGARVTAAAGGGLDVTLDLVDRRVVEPTGSVPKAVSRSGLRVDARPGRCECRFLVDV